MGENQVGVELDGHDARSTTRYSLSFTSVNGGEGLSKQRLVVAHGVRARAAARSSWATASSPGFASARSAASAGGPPSSRSATPTRAAPAADPRHRAATTRSSTAPEGELSWMLGYPATPASSSPSPTSTADEPAGLAETTGTGEDLSGSNSFNGGFIEVDWVPFSVSSYTATPWLFFARYDLVRFRPRLRRHRRRDARGSPIPRARTACAAAIHLEGHLDRVKEGRLRRHERLGRRRPDASGAGRHRLRLLRRPP